ncbi:prepilin-type N-terminal cleavage/methylation domain-containing protein [Mannheimia massilioguelmaensis]|uniref:prepilin-type N-terminal cleavage/methylation domain-containing protein n=1 Tax=Mannheimia massilioguelmaensis TaxID=1604354 RepID=UPI0005C90E38|nr:prepilin-type N-terminal cleavage/methylation domain-containing protein [Mannheimia massilioguelmaensis]
MLKGFTLLEVLIVILLLSLSVSIAIPSWKSLEEKQMLQQEQKRLLLFIKHIQARVENSHQIWHLVVNHSSNNHVWCIVAHIKKDNMVCDCLKPNTCSQELYPHFYHPLFPTQVKFVGKKYYPQIAAKLGGIRRTTENNCFSLVSQHEQAVLSFSKMGNISIKDKKSHSACFNSGVSL